MNQPWQYKNQDGQWISFDCTECILLELAFFTFTTAQSDQYSTVEIPMGKVNFKFDTIAVSGDNGEVKKYDIMRSNTMDR